MSTAIVRPGKLRLAFLGDSITVGDGDWQARGWPSRLCEASRSIPEKKHCYNLGVGGDRIANLASRASSELSARFEGRNGRGVVIMIGVNDALRAAAIRNTIALDLVSIEADLNSILNNAKRYGAVLVVEPTPVLPEFQHADGMDGKAVMAYLDVINQLLASVCKAQDVTLIGLTKTLQTDQLFIKALQNGDGLHPNDAGFDCIAKHLLGSPEWSAFLEAAAND